MNIYLVHFLMKDFIANLISVWFCLISSTGSAGIGEECKTCYIAHY